MSDKLTPEESTLATLVGTGFDVAFCLATFIVLATFVAPWSQIGNKNDGSLDLINFVAEATFATSLAGCLVGLRVLIFERPRRSSGTDLWMLHGLASLFWGSCKVYVEVIRERSHSNAWGAIGIIRLTTASVIVVQIILTMVAIARLLRNQPISSRERFVSWFCIWYAAAIGGWLYCMWN